MTNEALFCVERFGLSNKLCSLVWDLGCRYEEAGVHFNLHCRSGRQQFHKQFNCPVEPTQIVLFIYIFHVPPFVLNSHLT